MLRIFMLSLFAVWAIPQESTNVANGGKQPKIKVFTGKVVPLAEALRQHGVDMDDEASPHWLGLQTEEGKLYPLVQDAGSRLFFRDPRLLKRPMEIQGRILPDSQLLHVLQVHSLKDGELHEVYYWCEVCSIRRPNLEKENVCECCGGPMELREPPVEK